MLDQSDKDFITLALAHQRDELAYKIADLTKEYGHLRDEMEDLKTWKQDDFTDWKEAVDKERTQLKTIVGIFATIGGIIIGASGAVAAFMTSGFGLFRIHH